MSFENKELEKRIKLIDEQLKNMEALKLNDKYQNYEADLAALRSYKLAIVEKIVSNMPYIKEAAKDLAQIKLDSLKEQLDEANANINDIDQSLQDIYAEEENSEEVNEYFEDLYGTDELEADRRQLNRQISSYTNYVKDPSWMLQKSFERNVKFDEGTGYIPSFFARGICFESESSNYIDYKEDVSKINIESFLDVVNEYMSESFVESILDEIPLPNFSNALEEYSETHINPYDVIPNLLTQAELDEMKEAVSDVNNLAAISNEKDSDALSDYKNYQTYASIKKSTELNAKTVKTLLCGLTAKDGEKYTERLGEIIAILAEDSEKITERKIPLLGLKIDDKSDYHKYSLMADYVKELFRRTEVFETNTNLYTDGIDFDKVAKDAEAKYHGKVNEERVHKFYESLNIRGRERVSDRGILYARINGLESESERIKAYQNIIKECLNGTSSLTGYDNGKKLPCNTKTIGEIASHLRSLYNEEYEEQSREFRVNNQGDAVDLPKSFNGAGINQENEKRICESFLDGNDLAREMMLKFNNELNLYKVEGAELEALNDKDSYEDTDIYKKASAKTEGLQCDKNSPLLNDAIATYGRLKEIHDNRRLYWLFHPFKNASENRALKEMKQTLQNRYGFTNQELNAKVQEVKANATDNINKNFVKGNDENYQRLLENEKTNDQERRKIITDKLVAIDDARKLRMENVTFIQSEKLRQGAYIDNVDLSPKKNEMDLPDFVNHLEAVQKQLYALNEKLLGGASQDKDAFDKEVEDHLNKEIEGYVDFEGFQHDEKENYSDKSKEVEIMIKLAKATDEAQIKKLKEILAKNNELNELKKDRRDLNSELRLNKFNKMVSENDLANLHIKKDLQDENLLNKNLKALDEKINYIEEVNDLEIGYSESFNKFLDQDMLQNNQEKQTMDKLKEKFDLSLDEVSDEKEVQESKDKQPVIEEEHIEL